MLVDYSIHIHSMFSNISKYSWFVFVPFVLLGVSTVVLILTGIIPLAYLLFTLFGWMFISGLGVAVGYHRIFSHNNYPNLARWKENIILLLGTLSGQGSSIYWSALHKGYHHRFSDTDRDMHSPTKGLYHAFFGWTIKATQKNQLINFKYAGNLLRKKNHIWFHENQLLVLWFVPILMAFIDWKISLTLFCLPTCLALLQDNTVNVVGHLKCLIGYRNFNTSDNSHNNIILGYLGWGQGWHNNHHHDPKSFDFGKSISGKWWEWDPCNIFKIFLK